MHCIYILTLSPSYNSQYIPTVLMFDFLLLIVAFLIVPVVTLGMSLFATLC